VEKVSSAPETKTLAGKFLATDARLLQGLGSHRHPIGAVD